VRLKISTREMKNSNDNFARKPENGDWTIKTVLTKEWLGVDLKNMLF
jgi:hypothetical protein